MQSKESYLISYQPKLVDFSLCECMNDIRSTTKNFGGVKMQSNSAQESIPLTPTTEYYRSIFDRADLDGDGFVNVTELHQMIRNDDVENQQIPRPIVQRIISMSDTNHDGRLSYDEFVTMLNDPKLENLFGKYVQRYVRFIVPRRQYGDVQQDGLYEEQYTCCPPQLGMIIISLIELCFFMVDEICEEDSTKYATGPMANVLIYDPTKRYEAWRFVTYMFVHIGYLHLVVNLAVQIFIGVPLEMVHSWWRILLIYTSGVLAGSLGTSIADPNVKLAGASGGVYSLITAHIASIIMNWHEMTFPGVQLVIFLLITSVDVGTSIYHRYVQNINEHIGYVAHLAGAIAGLLVGINVLRNLKVTKKETILWWISISIYTVLMLMMILWNIFYNGYFPKSM